jgi:hypothetical protein
VTAVTEVGTAVHVHRQSLAAAIRWVVPATAKPDPSAPYTIDRVQVRIGWGGHTAHLDAGLRLGEALPGPWLSLESTDRYRGHWAAVPLLEDPPDASWTGSIEPAALTVLVPTRGAKEAHPLLRIDVTDPGMLTVLPTDGDPFNLRSTVGRFPDLARVVAVELEADDGPRAAHAAHLVAWGRAAKGEDLRIRCARRVVLASVVDPDGRVLRSGISMARRP